MVISPSPFTQEGVRGSAGCRSEGSVQAGGSGSTSAELLQPSAQMASTGLTTAEDVAVASFYDRFTFRWHTQFWW